MSDVTITARPQSSRDSGTVKSSAWSPLWRRITLGAVMLISVFMNFYQLGQNGFANPFYAAGVRSMLDSWHNFFFVSYDPGGFVTIDKPATWLLVADDQRENLRIYGFQRVPASGIGWRLLRPDPLSPGTSSLWSHGGPPGSIGTGNQSD